MKIQFNKIVMSFRMLLALITVLLTSSSLFAQLNLSQELPVDPKVKVGKLSNGLTYYIRQNSRPEKKVELRLVVKTGSIMEDDDQQGLAHFTEHMAFNGTKNFQKNDLVSFLQSIGVEFGADLNAYTSFDETVYILPIPVDKPENLDKGFQILEDWASTVTFDNSEIDKERGVVLEESRLGKGANDRMLKVWLPKLLAGSKYAERLPIGKDELLKTFKYDAIKRFYGDWYRPNLMAVIVVGDIDPAEAEKKIKSHFEKLKNPSKERKREYANVPPRAKSEGVVVTDKEATNFILQIYYSTEKTTPETTLGDYRLSIIKQLFASMLNQRMQELTQKATPPFIFGASSLGGFVHGYELYSSFAVLTQTGVEPAVNAIIQENERARKFGFTAAELDRVKKSSLRSMERAYNEREKSESGNYAAEYIQAFLEQEPIPGIENEFKYFNELMDGITLEEINKYAASTIPTVDKKKLVILMGPEKAPFQLPTNEDLLAMTDAATKLEVTPYEEKEIATSLMSEAPKEGRVIMDKELKDISARELSLGNGVKVILKPTDFKNDQVMLTATRFGGQYLYDKSDKLNAQYASTVVGQMGIGEFSPTDLRKVLAGKTVGVSPRLGTYSEGFFGQSGSKDVESLLQLVHLYMTAPRKDEELFNSFVSKQQAMYQNMLSDPGTVFQDELYGITYGDHPWAPKMPQPGDFVKVNLDRALEIYKDRFCNASGFTFVIVGSFDVAEIKPLLAKYIASIPAGDARKEVKDVGLRPAKGIVKKEVRKGEEQKSQINISFYGEAPYSAAEDLKLDVLLEVLNITVIETLREDMSGVYGAGVYGGIRKYPYNNYSITVSMPCGPENVDKLIAASFNEIDKVIKNGPKEEDINKVKETLKKKYEENMKENVYWARAIQGAIEYGSDPKQILDYKQRLDAITVKEIKETAKKYFDMKNYIQAVLYPEK